MEVRIDSDIPMPVTTRGGGTGDARVAAIEAGLAGIKQVQKDSWLLPFNSYDDAIKERRHYLNRANSVIGKRDKKIFTVVAVDFTPEVPAVPAKPAVTADPKTGRKAQPAQPEIPAKPARPAGLRFWLKGYATEAVKPATTA